MKSLSILKRNKNFEKYKISSLDSWSYKAPKGMYYTEFFIVEDRIIYEYANGTPSLQDAKHALLLLSKIVEDNFKSFKPHCVSDSRDIKGANSEVRKYVAEFHKNNPIFESVSLIANPFTKALFSIVKGIGVGDLKKWKVYRNENYCIDEILEGQIVIGQSQESSEYELIYKALADLSTDRFSYEQLLNTTNSNEELSSVVQAINIINEESKLKQQEFDLTFDGKGSFIRSNSILYKSIVENTESIVVLMNEDYSISNTNDNFNKIFGAGDVEGEDFKQYLNIEDDHFKSLEKDNHAQFVINYNQKTFSCKLYRIDTLERFTYVVFVGVDITEKESLKASEQKLLLELQEQNFKLLKVNHLLSHEVNHQIASLSQILNEYSATISKDVLVGNMISKVHDDLNQSLARMNQTLFTSDSVAYNTPDEVVFSKDDCLDVFLIDDDEITNMLNEKVVQNNLPNANLTVFLDAEEAIEFMKDQQIPDVIFLDMYMPEMDGFDFLKKIRSIKNDKSPRIFMLSSSRDPKDIKLVKTFPEVKEYIIKPLSNDKVKEVLKL